MPKAVNEIQVLLDQRDFTISVRGKIQVTTSEDVVWKFGCKNGENPSKNFLPKGWVPMVSFATPEETGEGSYSGPFQGLTQVLEEKTKKGRSRFLIHGHWDGEPAQEGPRSYEYYVFLHRDLGGDDPERFAVLGSAKKLLEIEGRAAAPRGEKTATVRVTRGERLIVAEELVPVDTETEIEWDFRGVDLRSFFPLVLFYEYQRPNEPDPRSSRKKKRIHFGPFRKMSFQGKKVIGSEVTPKKGTYHYETVLFSTRDRSVRFINSGDPRIDNEGEPREGKGKRR